MAKLQKEQKLLDAELEAQHLLGEVRSETRCVSTQRFA